MYVDNVQRPVLKIYLKFFDLTSCELERFNCAETIRTAIGRNTRLPDGMFAYQKYQI
jgi:hypothetical protein